MDLAKVDEELLELAAVQVPWYMVCADFHELYGSADALVRRLFELRDAGLLAIHAARPGAPITREAMVTDALDHGCYEDFESSREPRWEIVATDAGYERIRARLGAQ